MKTQEVEAQGYELLPKILYFALVTICTPVERVHIRRAETYSVVDLDMLLLCLHVKRARVILLRELWWSYGGKPASRQKSIHRCGMTVFHLSI